MATITIEAHTLDTRTGEWCDICATPSRLAVDVAIVASDSLRVLARATGSLCTGCLDEQVWRTA